MKTTSTTALTNDEYRSVEAISKSELDYHHQGSALVEWSKNAPSVGSDSVDLGTHVHCALLEPDVFASGYVKTPDFDGRTKAGREQKEAFKAAFDKEKIVLDSDCYSSVVAMRDSVLAHPVANQLLTSQGASEVSIFSEIGGQKVKCRPDRIPDPELFGHILVDVKKTADIDTFAKSVFNFRYHVQAAFYSDIHKRLTGHLPRFVFVVVGEKRSIGRHPVRVFELPEEAVEAGRMAYLEDLEKAREYYEFGCGLEIETLAIPNYIKF